LYLTRRKNKDQITGLLSPLLEYIRLKNVCRWIFGKQILDCGCGSAKILNFLQGDYIYTGIDVAPQIIYENTILFPRFNFLCLNLERDNLSDLGKFDSIILSAVIEHLHNPILLLKKLYTHVHKETRLIISTPSPKFLLLMRIGLKLKILSKEAHSQHKKMYTKHEIEELLQKSGFKLKKYCKFLLGTNQLVIASPH